MLFFDGGLALIAFAVWVFCIIDVITTPEDEVRNIPKLVWLFLVIFLLDVGAIAWLVAGRNWNRTPADLPYRGNRGRYPAHPSAARSRATSPDDDEEFLAGLRARAEEQRRRAREAQRPNDQHDGDSPTG